MTDPIEGQRGVCAPVGILPRIISALSYALPAFGAAVSAWLFIGVLRAMRNAEAAGIGAVAAGLSEANVAILVTLYLAVILGIVGVAIGLVRAFTPSTTASPSAWYFLITALIGFVPMLTLWRGQSLLLDVLFSPARPAGGVAAVASDIVLMLMFSIATGLVSVLILLASAVVPFPRFLRAKRKWAPVLMVLIMEGALIAMTVAYHLRTAWLYAEYQQH